jgi:hypothetical protein
MQNEMNQLFAEGGVMQEGGTVDPVSGNDVPPGAMKEEVRDDIDAKLSEGEFVIPADVVRYIGLETLMKLRDKAKAGLKKMEEIGQMGNAEEVENPEALHSDEEEVDDESFSSEIDSILGEDNEQEFAKGGDVRKYAPGGYVGGEENKQLYADAPIRGFEMVAMTNDAGQTIYIPFINGVAQLSIPAGYKVKTPTAGTTPTPTTGGDGGAATTQPVESGGGDGGPSDGGGTTSGPNISMTPEGPVANTVSPTLGSLAGMVVGMVTGLPPSITAQIGKSVANQMNFAADQATMNVSVAQADTSNPANNEGITTAAATPTAPGGPQGTGGAAAAAASSAAAAASAAGHSAESIAAASQAAATATVNGQSPADAAAAGQDAANANAADAADAEGGGLGTAATGGVGGVSGVSASDGSGTAAGEGTGGTAPGDSGDGGTGAASSAGDGGASAGDGSGPGSGDGDGGYAKGGFVSKRKDKKTNKSTSFVTRQK